MPNAADMEGDPDFIAICYATESNHVQKREVALNLFICVDALVDLPLAAQTIETYLYAIVRQLNMEKDFQPVIVVQGPSQVTMESVMVYQAHNASMPRGLLDG